MRTFNSILVTGGAGFIGSHVVRKLLTNRPDAKVVNLDALTYAGNLENLRDIESNPHYTFVKGDIQDSTLIERFYRTRLRCRGALGSGKPRRPKHRKPHGIPRDQHPRNRDAAERSTRSLGRCGRRSLLLPHLNGRSLWFAGRKGSSQKKPRTIPAAPTAPQKHQVTTWCGPGTIPTGCQWSYRIVPTTTAPTNFLKSSSPDDSEHPRWAAFACVWGRHQRTRLAVGGRPRFGH